MKTTLIALLAVLALPALGGQDYKLTVPSQDSRKWTQLGTDKTIDAKLVEKSKDGKKVRLELVSGKDFWVEVANLKQADTDFIAAWQKLPEDFSYLKVVETDGKPIKELKPGERFYAITSTAPDEDVIVVAETVDGKFKSAELLLDAGVTHTSYATLSESPCRVTMRTKADGKLIAEWVFSK